MQPFKLTLANGATLTGRQNIPPITDNLVKCRPLVVGLHGGSYSSQYFDIDERVTAAHMSTALGVPFVSIDRPCYGDRNDTTSLSILPIPEGSSFPEEYGSVLHNFILPALWAEFGADSASIVLHCHSLGTPGAIIAAGLHSQEIPHDSVSPATTSTSKSYPLAGIVFSGWGSQAVENPLIVHTKVWSDDGSFLITDSMEKTSTMLPAWSTSPATFEAALGVNNPLPIVELASIADVWLPRWREEWAPHVKVPVMACVSGRDALWVTTQDHVQDLTSCFTRSPRVDGSLIIGAPHSIEMSHWSQGWYAHSFGFALECAAFYNYSKSNTAMQH